jgi:2-haloalkanoic acid dehalogenase type II
VAFWDGIRALTFDCYGTLVDWETGILRDLRRALGDAGTDDELLLAYAKSESALEAGPFQPYRVVLEEAARGVAAAIGRAVPEGRVFDLPSWPPFPDTADALRRLGLRFRLCITSNVDRDLFLETEKALGVRFDEVVTADEVASYKPRPAHLTEAMRRLGLGPAEIVHVAQSLHHDVAMAKPLGVKTCWVDRRAGRPGGAVLPADPIPDLRVTTLAELADRVDAELQGVHEGNVG